MEIKDIKVEFEGDTLTKYGLFALLVWFLIDILHLPKRLKLLTVKNKRNRERPTKRRHKPFPAFKMCLALVVIILLGIKRFEKIKPLLSTEEKLANLIGLPRFFGVTTARNFINEFSLWHLRQLDAVNTQILKEFGESSIQDLPILDIDGTTHSVESQKREKAVIGYNKKNKGKPCYQWSVGFIREEAISQKLHPGNTKTGAFSHFEETVSDTQKKLGIKNLIIRVDGLYCNSKMLNYCFSEGHQFVTTANYNWVRAYKETKLEEANWRQYDEKTRLYDLGWGKTLNHCPNKLRIILVEKEQEKLKMKKRKKLLHYAIITNISFLSEPESIYEFHHQRQTIENFFKEAKNPFNAGKMPSQLFRGNEAYLHLVTIAYNCFHIFKKNICQQASEESLLRHLKIGLSPMEQNYPQKMTKSGLLE